MFLRVISLQHHRIRTLHGNRNRF